MAYVSLHRFPDRAAAKAASRARDDAALGAGLISRADLRASNGAFSALNISRASVGRRGVLAN